LPFGTQVAKTQHFSDQEWKVAKSGSRRKAIRFGVGLAVIPGKHTEDLLIGADGVWKASNRTVADSVIESSTTGTVALLSVQDLGDKSDLNGRRDRSQ
jgi:hypothetical protein